MRDGPDRYLDLAAECRELAETSLSADARRRWLTLADTWVSLHSQVVELALLEKRDVQRFGLPDDGEAIH